MKKILFKILGAAFLYSALISFTSCGGKKSSVAQIKEEIHFAINAAPPSIDVQLITNIVGKMVVEGTVFQQLVQLDENNKITPVLAESFKVNSDSTEFVYKLRKGVKFHNGEIMTADDVVASMNRFIGKVSGIKKLCGESRFEKIDESTVKISFAKSNIFFNETIASGNNFSAIYPKSVIDAADPKTGYVTSFIGTGPYRFVEWVPDQYILLEKFDGYIPFENGAKSGWAAPKKAVTNKLYYDFVKDDATRVAGIQTGEYDIIYKAPYENYEMLKSNPKLTIFNSIYGDSWCIFNKKAGLGANKLIRQAVQLALNNEEILLGGYSSKDFFRLNSSFMLKEQGAWYTPEADVNYNKHDTEKAKALLKEAGYNGEEFIILCSPDYSDMYNTGLVICKQLQEVGINAKILTADWATLGSYRTNPEKYTVFISTGPSPLLPSSIFYITPNWAGWASDEKLQSMIGEMNTMPDIEKAIAKWHEIQIYCSTDYVPMCHIGDIYRYSVGSSKLKDVELTRYGPALWNAYCEK